MKNVFEISHDIAEKPSVEQKMSQTKTWKIILAYKKYPFWEFMV